MSTQTVSQVHRWPARAAGTRSHITGLVLCCSVLFLLHAGNQGVMERFSGEAWYALISKNMAESRNYLVPLFFDKPFFDKPILYYWVQILSFRLFGTNEFAIVFPSGLFGLLTVLATYLFTSRFLDAGTGLLSAALLATTVSFFIRARHAETDSLFTFFLTLAFFSLYRAIHAPERRRAAFWLSCLAMGLASLTKGPLGVLFPGLIGGLYLLITRNAAHFRHLPLASGLAILAAVALPWYGIITYLYGWHFIQEFLVRNHLERFFGLERGLLTYPFWFYVPALLFGFLPWSPFLVAALAAGAATGRRLFDPRHRLSLYLGLWVTVMFLTFSLARGKNEYYLLPAYPALAILVARYLRNRAGSTSARLPLDFAGGATLSALLLLGTGVTVAFGLQPSPWSG
ncbi:MAG: glycosyltransferase family 39 protein [Candidatus Rokubacteria bacterium]|nr:glycosyltransferase family 39 protein [Candidatus Rokubacteria bacterium]